MLKKRLIFTLLYQKKNFYLSRNFRLQKIGDIKWLKKNYNFTLLTRCVDEIILLDVSREKQNLKDFVNIIKKISEDCFIPLSVGGKIVFADIDKSLCLDPMKLEHLITKRTKAIIVCDYGMTLANHDKIKNIAKKKQPKNFT